MPEHRLLADEHIAKSVVSRLESFGIEASHIDELEMKGYTDQEILEFAENEEYLILTRDDDFKKIISSSESVGVLYLTKRMKKKRTASEVIKVLNSMKMDELKGILIHIPWS